MNYRLYRRLLLSGPILLFQTELNRIDRVGTEGPETCNFATLLWRCGSNRGFDDQSAEGR